MLILKRIFAPIWKTWFFLVFLSSFFLLYPLFHITIKTKKFKTTFLLKRIWSYCIAYGSGIFPKLIYQQKTKKMPQPCVFVANHTSYLDIVLSTFILDHLTIYMAKAELLKVPLFKVFFQGMDIAVKRTNKMDAHKAFLQAGNEIDKGRSMIIFPEGTIPKNNKLALFKNGAFKLAIDKQVPIVPIVYLNNNELLENGGYFKTKGRPGIAKAIILESIETIGLTEKDVDELKQKVYNLIQNTLIEYNGAKN